MRTSSISSGYLNAQVVVTAPGLCSGVHVSQRQHSDIRQNNHKQKKKKGKKRSLSNPRVRIQRAVHPVRLCGGINRSHGSLPPPPSLFCCSLCCGVGSWSGLKSRQSVREAGSAPARSSSTLPRRSAPAPAAGASYS